MISLAKAAGDPAGHYSRPDVTQLLFNRKRREPVVLQGPAEPEPAVAEPVSTPVEAAAAAARQPVAA
jgi:aliphatic nitrilase